MKLFRQLLATGGTFVVIGALASGATANNKAEAIDDKKLNESKEIDPAKEDKACGDAASTLKKVSADKASKGLSTVARTFGEMRNACKAFRGCAQDCRSDKRDCRRAARSDELACKAECAKKRGGKKRRCKRDCRKKKRSARRECRHEKAECKAVCRDKFDRKSCAKARRAFWNSVHSAQRQAANKKGARAKVQQVVTACKPLYGG